MSQHPPDDDTTADAREFLRRRYAAMSLAERVECLRGVTMAANHMALTGLRLRRPEASEGELLLELARLRLGDELVRSVYGPVECQ